MRHAGEVGRGGGEEEEKEENTQVITFHCQQTLIQLPLVTFVII